MRTFYPNWFVCRLSSFVYKNLTRTDRLICFHIKLLYAYSTVSAIFRFIIRSLIIINNICLTIFIKKERRINTSDLRQHDGFRPFTKRVLRLNKEISGSDIGCYHIICLVIRIIRNSRSKNTATHFLSFHIH